MAQTTGQISRAKATIEVSTDGSTWTAADNVIVTTSFSGAEQHTGQTNTLDGQAPLVTNANKYSATEISVEAVYTETASQLWDTARDQWESTDQTIYFRYAPSGDTSGNLLFTAANDAGTAIAVPIISLQVPDTDANSGEASVVSMDLIASKLAESTVTT